MKNDYYVPQPIDTSDVELSVEVTALVEELAKKTWAQTRISQG